MFRNYIISLTPAEISAARVLIVLVMAYVLMVGPAPSMLRAAAMSSLALMAAPLGRIADYRNLFFTAGFLVLLLHPANLFDVGFQLSFLAVAALIWISPIIEGLLRSQKNDDENKQPSRIATKIQRYVGDKVSREVVSVIIGTTAVSLATTPIVCYYFHYISLVSLPANLAIVFTVPLAFLDSFMSVLTSLIPGGTGYVGFIGTASTRVMLWAVDYLGSLKYGAISIQSPGLIGLAGYYALLYAVIVYVRSRYVER